MDVPETRGRWRGRPLRVLSLGWSVQSFKELARATGYRTGCDIGNRLRRLAARGKILYGGGPRQIAVPPPHLQETQDQLEVQRMNLSELQKEAHAIAVAHGWWDEERTFGELIALVHSELSEALEAYRQYGDMLPRLRRFHQIDGWSTGLADEHGGQPVGVPSELADVVIRIVDMAEYYEGTLTAEGGTPEQASVGDWIALAHYWLSQAYGEVPRYRATNLNNCLVVVYRMIEHYGIDLDAAIEAKMEYNRTRSYRHGGKAL